MQYVFLIILTGFTGFYSTVLKAEELCGVGFQKIGLSKQDITPQKKLTLGGFGTYFLFSSSTRQNGEGIHDPLYAQSFAIETDQSNLVIVSTDLVGLSTASIKRIKDLITRERDQPIKLIISSSHNHNSPDTLGLWGALPFQSGRDNSYMAAMESKIAQSVNSALESMACRSLAISTTTKDNSAPEFYPLAKTVQTIWIAEKNGQIAGSLTGWSAHPTVLGADNNTVSADYVGSFRYFMTQKHSGNHIYINGILGDVYPKYDPQDQIADPFADGDQDEEIRHRYRRSAHIGQDLAERVSSQYAQRKPISESGRWNSKSLRFSMTVKNRLFRIAESLKIVEARGLQTGSVETSIHLTRSDGVIFASLPGEVFPSVATAIYQEIKTVYPDDKIIFLGLGNDWLGYILSDEDYFNDDYRYHRTLAPDPKAAVELIEAYRRIL